MRLAGKNDLHQFLARRFKIREHADDFQHGLVEILRFVDHYNEPLARSGMLQQSLVHLRLQLDQVAAVVFDSQIDEHAAQQITRTALGLKEEYGASRSLKLLQEMEKNGGLSHPRLGNQCRKPAPNRDAIKRGCKRFTMRWTEIQISRVRGYPERLLREFVEVQNHST